MQRDAKDKKEEDPSSSKKGDATSWGSVAGWYDEYLGNEDTYQEKVIAPNLLRVLDIKSDDKVLDVACGQGYFAKKFVEAGADVVGADISDELVALARARIKKAKFYVAPATELTFSQDATFDAATVVLAIQNIKDLHAAVKEITRALKSGGRLVLVLNHPTFRIPRASSWGWDEENKTQYRRVDSYLSESSTQIVMHPGNEKSEKTISYHRSLQDYFKALTKSGLSVTRLEEWISHKKSEKGPRQTAEDVARKEIPLFMMIEAKKQ